MPPQAGDVGSVGRGAVLRDDGLQVRTLPPEVVDGTCRAVAPAAVPPVPVGPGDRLRGPSTGSSIPPKHSASALTDPGLPRSFRNRIVPTPVIEVNTGCGKGRRL